MTAAPRQAELLDLRERVVDALISLSEVALGSYAVELKLDFTTRDPLNAIFASLNELIAAFGSEQEQSRAFRRELEDKLLIVEKQRAAIRELSTPIIELWEGVLCLPVVGIMDTARSTEMTNALLQAIIEKKTRFTIIDITGIEVMDTGTVDHFMRMAKSIRLLGADCALTGISPLIAQTVVQMGIELDEITTERSLRDALVSYVRRS